MNERLLQYIWMYQYFNQFNLLTAQGDELEIISPGRLNTDQGPDFSSARIKINGQEWCGNIELHVNSSDWLLHRHDEDQNYCQVILHVVWNNNNDTISIPQLELQPRVPTHLLKTYAHWMENGHQIPCEKSIHRMEEQRLHSWLQWLSAKRLAGKSNVILQKVMALGMNWEEAFWHAVARNFGHRVNADSFERIAASIPVNILIRHSNSIVQLEALLLGQAGLLRTDNADQYPRMLYQEYVFLRKKYNLAKLNEPVHFLRMRPVNFPTVRLAQLAALLYNRGNLFARICTAQNPEGIRNMLKVTANDYWHYHYRFGESSPFREKTVGESLTNSIMVNTVIPFLHAYSHHQGKEDRSDLYHSWLEGIAPEKNAFLFPFTGAGIKPRHAADTQALLECRRHYCDALLCLKCGIGKWLLRHEEAHGQLK
jgi:hypothetical protein